MDFNTPLSDSQISAPLREIQPQGQDRFLGLVSLEFPELEGLLAKATYQKQELYLQWQTLLKQRCDAYQAQLLRIHQASAFLSFPDELTLADSIEQAIAFIASLAQDPLVLPGLPAGQGLVFKAGLALQSSGSNPDPIATLSERSQAPNNGVVFTTDVLQVIGRRRYPVQPLALWSRQNQWQAGLNAAEQFWVLSFAVGLSPSRTIVSAEENPPLKPSESPALDLLFTPMGQQHPDEEPEEEREASLDRFLLRQSEDLMEAQIPLGDLPHEALQGDGFNAYPVEGFSMGPGAASLENEQAIGVADSSVPVSYSGASPVSVVNEASVPELMQAAALPKPVAALKPFSVQPSQNYLDELLKQNWQQPALPLGPSYFISNPEATQATSTYKASVELLTKSVELFCSPHEPAEGKFCLLSSDPGFGKSTILQMLRMALEPTVTEEGAEAPDAPFIWLSGYAWQANMPYPLQLWVDLFRNLFGFPVDGLQTEGCYQHLAQMLVHIYGDPVPEPALDFFIRLMALKQPEPLEDGFEQTLDTALPFLMDWFHRASQIKPMILVLEDIDQADEGSLHWLQQLLTAGLLHGKRIFLIATHNRHVTLNPELWPLHMICSEHEACFNLRLLPFSKHEMLRFLDEGPLNGHSHKYPDALLEQLYFRSQGLALWIEEYIRYLTVKGLLQFDPNREALMPKEANMLALVELPSQLEVLLEQRTFTLDEAHRYLLQAASVLGERFSMEALGALSQMPVEALQQSLQYLWEQGWVMPDVGGGAAFRHSLLWQYWYGQTPQATRQKLHMALLQFYQQQQNNHTISVHPARLAWHALAVQQGELAFHSLNLCGVWAAQLTNGIGALQAFRAALPYLQALPPSQQPSVALQLQETAALLLLNSQPAFSEQAFYWAIKQAHQAGDSAKVFHLLNLLSSSLELQGFYAEALAPVESCIAMAVPQTEPLDYAVLLTTKLDYLMKRAHFGEASNVLYGQLLPHIGNGMLLEEDPSASKALLMSERMKGQLQWAALQTVAARDTLEKALYKARQLDSPLSQVSIQFACCDTALGLGQVTLVQQLLNHVLMVLQPLSTASTNPYYARWGLMAVKVHLAIGDTASAELLLPNALTQAEEAKDSEVVLRLQLEQLRLLSLQDLHQAALSQMPYLLQDIERSSLTGLEIELLALKAECLAGLGSWQEAHMALEQALALLNHEATSHPLQHLTLEVQMAMLAIEAGWLEDGGKLLQSLWHKVISAGLPPLIAKTALAIALLYSKQAKQAEHLGQASLQHQLQAKADTFAERASGFWERLLNPYQATQVKQVLSRA